MSPFLRLRLRLSLSLSLLVILFITSCQLNPYKQGHALYKIHCESCHMEDGSGLADLIPSLQASDMFKSDPGQLICLIKYGRDKNELTGQRMPADTAMNEVEITNLVNYLRQAYVKGSVAVQTQEVRKCLSACKPD